MLPRPHGRKQAPIRASLVMWYLAPYISSLKHTPETIGSLQLYEPQVSITLGYRASDLLIIQQSFREVWHTILSHHRCETRKSLLKGYE